METRILSLPDALKLASIMGKYVPELPEPNSNVSTFFDSIFEKFEPVDFKLCIELFTDSPLKEMGGEELLVVIFEGMKKNKIMTLLKTSKDLGFI